MNPIPCTICGEAGHSIRRCPTLVSPLHSGFYAPPAGHRPSGDDDDEHIKLKIQSTQLSTIPSTKCLNLTSKLEMLSRIPL
jgi:hypothetical protein